MLNRANLKTAATMASPAAHSAPVAQHDAYIARVLLGTPGDHLDLVLAGDNALVIGIAARNAQEQAAGGNSLGHTRRDRSPRGAYGRGRVAARDSWFPGGWRARLAGRPDGCQVQSVRPLALGRRLD